jgi:glycosyltransferase involved in cell wall biosynthesis
MKIIYNTDQVYLHGGIEKVIAEKANYMADVFGYQVFILTTEQRDEPVCYPLSNSITLIDLKINYNRKKSYFSYENVKKAIYHFIRQRKVLQQLQADALISPNYNFDFYWLPFIVKKTTKIKELHGSRYSDYQNKKNQSFISKYRSKFNNWIFSQYSHLVVLNDSEKVYIPLKNVVVIPNPVSIPKVQAQLVNKQVIAAGRIAPVKGFDQLIAAWGEVHKQYPEWQLHIYGQDYLGTKASLVQQIMDNGMENVVFFKEPVVDLQQTLLEYSIYAMSSETECFPMVLLESLSVGVPIVSYDCPTGPRHIIKNNEDGLLVPYNDTGKLASSLIELMTDNKKRVALGRNAYKNSCRFAVDIVMLQWLLLIQNSKNV